MKRQRFSSDKLIINYQKYLKDQDFKSNPYMLIKYPGFHKVCSIKCFTDYGYIIEENIIKNNKCFTIYIEINRYDKYVPDYISGVLGEINIFPDKQLYSEYYTPIKTNTNYLKSYNKNNQLIDFLNYTNIKPNSQLTKLLKDNIFIKIKYLNSYYVYIPILYLNTGRDLKDNIYSFINIPIHNYISPSIFDVDILNITKSGLCKYYIDS
ncbi:MAG: hypothetical protein MJ224_07040 [archaeon]|nr:hypothetical protein [archaeon]